MAGLAGRIVEAGTHRSRLNTIRQSDHSANSERVSLFGTTSENAGWNERSAVPALAYVTIRTAGTALRSFQPANYKLQSLPDFQTIRFRGDESGFGNCCDFERWPAAVDPPGNPCWEAKQENKHDPRLRPVGLVSNLPSPAEDCTNQPDDR